MSDIDRPAGVEARHGGSEAHLVLARPSDAGADAYCRNRLAASGHPESMPITVLTDSETDDRPRDSDAGERRGVVVAVGGDTRGSAAACNLGADGVTPPATVPAPGDLGAVGRTVDDLLTAWAGQGHRPVVCVDSLDGLLEHESIRGAYRFLYVLRRRIEEVDGEVHVHVDPSAHEEEILRTFFSVSDRVIAFDDGGPPLL